MRLITENKYFAILAIMIFSFVFASPSIGAPQAVTGKDNGSPRKRHYRSKQKKSKIEIVIDESVSKGEPDTTLEETPGVRKKRQAFQLRELEEVFETCNIEGFYKIMDPGHVVLELVPGSGMSRVYTREQAILLIKQHWGRGRTKSFRILEYYGLDSIDSVPGILVERKYSNSVAGEIKYEKLYFFLRKSKGKWIITGIRVASG